MNGVYRNFNKTKEYLYSSNDIKIDNQYSIRDCIMYHYLLLQKNLVSNNKSVLCFFMALQKIIFHHFKVNYSSNVCIVDFDCFTDKTRTCYLVFMLTSNTLYRFETIYDTALLESTFGHCAIIFQLSFWRSLFANKQIKLERSLNTLNTIRFLM